MSPNVLLVDLSSIAHMMFHASGDNPDPNATSTQTVARVRALASGQPHVAVCLDTPPYFRRDIDPTYKAQRDKDNNAVISHQIALTADILRADGFPVWSEKGYEADDVLASAVTWLQMPVTQGKPSNWPDDCTITMASADKDLLQLVSDRVSFHSLTSGNQLGPDEVKAKFGVWPHQMADYLCLVGDSSDNIQGAKGIGQKRAAELLDTFGNLDDALKAASEGAGLTPAISKSLQEFAPRLATVRELVTLKTDVPLPFEQVFQPRVPVDAVTFGDKAEMGSATRPPQHDAIDAIVADQVNGPDLTIRQPAQTAPPAAQAAPSATNGHSPPSQPTSVPVRVPEPEVLPPPALDPRWQLEPRSMAQAKQVAADLFASRMFSAYGNAPAVLSTIMAGRELGFQTMASLRAIHIIDGKPSLSAGAIHALVVTSGKAEYFRNVERTPERAMFVTKRHGDPEETSLSFTIEEGRQAWNGKRDDKGEPDAKAWAASGWGRNPSDMLVARALTKLARLVYPDITHGLYAPEELS